MPERIDIKKRVCSRCGKGGHYATTCTEPVESIGSVGRSLGAFLKSRRMANGVSEPEAAARSGASVFQVRRLENQGVPPMVELFIRVAESTTGMTIEEFLGEYRKFASRKPNKSLGPSASHDPTDPADN